MAKLFFVCTTISSDKDDLALLCPCECRLTDTSRRLCRNILSYCFTRYQFNYIFTFLQKGVRGSDNSQRQSDRWVKRTRFVYFDRYVTLPSVLYILCEINSLWGPEKMIKMSQSVFKLMIFTWLGENIQCLGVTGPKYLYNYTKFIRLFLPNNSKIKIKKKK